jgi:hypothetical protein
MWWPPVQVPPGLLPIVRLERRRLRPSPGKIVTCNVGDPGGRAPVRDIPLQATVDARALRRAQISAHGLHRLRHA